MIRPVVYVRRRVDGTGNLSAGPRRVRGSRVRFLEQPQGRALADGAVGSRPADRAGRDRDPDAVGLLGVQLRGRPRPEVPRFLGRRRELRVRREVHRPLLRVQGAADDHLRLGGDDDPVLLRRAAEGGAGDRLADDEDDGHLGRRVAVRRERLRGADRGAPDDPAVPRDAHRSRSCTRSWSAASRTWPPG